MAIYLTTALGALRELNALLHANVEFDTHFLSRRILVNVDGAGTQEHPVSLENNGLGSVTPHNFFICGKTFPGSAYNVLPGSFAVAANMPPPTQIEGLCP